jgi:hypothetical protein
MPGMHEWRFAWRRLTRDRGQTISAVVLLALGVSATIAMADMLDRLLLRPPVGVSAPERVVKIYEVATPRLSATPIAGNSVCSSATCSSRARPAAAPPSASRNGSRRCRRSCCCSPVSTLAICC